MERHASEGAGRPLGVVLAGGAASRMDGDKASRPLAGRPLLSYPLAALAEANLDAVVVAKPQTELPPVDAAILREPAEPRHPLLGVLAALRHAEGRPVLVLPCDAPLASSALVGRLVAAGTPVVARSGGRIHPLIAVYPATAAQALERAVATGASATEAITALGPAFVDASESETFNVNTPEDLAYAASILTRAL